VTEFVVDIKPSARRANGVVGTTVHRRGVRRRFEAREDAESWAAGLAARGSRTVWIRSANPNDQTGADAYLVSRRPDRGGHVRDGAFEPEGQAALDGCGGTAEERPVEAADADGDA
jgi:hypothetical protein